MSAFRVTPRALRDLEDIWAYTAERWGPDQAAAYLRRLNTRFEWLAENPELGRVRNDVHNGYRCFPEGRHLVFYVMGSDCIHIIGVPHMAMDLPEFFS